MMGCNFRILVVDDCEPHNYALTRMLQQAGAVVEQAYTGSEALVKASGKPDAVLLDIYLPDVDGFEVCRRLRADGETSGIPVMLVTALTQDAKTRELAENAGAKALLFYPIEKEQLISVIKGQIARSRSLAGS